MITHYYTDRAVVIAMIVVSVVIVLPVAGPIALIMYVAFRKLGHDAKTSKSLIILSVLLDDTKSYCFMHAYTCRVHVVLYNVVMPWYNIIKALSLPGKNIIA